MTRDEIVNRLAAQLLENPLNAESRRDLQQALDLDDLNFSYFLSLYRRKKLAVRETGPVEIFEEGRSFPGKCVAYPTAIAPPEMLGHLPHVDYRTQLQSSDKYKNIAKNATLWLKKMQAGTGSSMTRSTYLANIKKVPADQVKIGAKGTDLLLTVPDPAKPRERIEISIAEAQILQAVLEAKGGKFKAVILHDLVGPETEESIVNLWRKKSLLDPGKTYDELIRSLAPVTRRSGSSFQAFFPTLREADSALSFRRQAPGGHALFALEALRAAYIDALRPRTDGSPLVSAIGNGEDLSSTPDPVMIGWMIAEKVPIAMITTEKTRGDLKGGQIALVKDADGSIYTTIIERAQAEASGQASLFEKLGIEFRRNQQMAFFNTNVALFNYDLLVPRIKALVQELGEDEFMRIIAPDLILNLKEQRDSDGRPGRYIQLEGAMGSSLLNFDRYWRRRFSEPLVHFINVDRSERTRFFSPIKSAFDYFMQFHSDLFEVEPDMMRLIHRRPGSLPTISLKDAGTKDKYYQDVRNVLDSFEGASLLELDSLRIEGQVHVQDAILKGEVHIRNRGPRAFDLGDFLKKNPAFASEPSSRDPSPLARPVLQNIEIEITAEGKVLKNHLRPA